MMSPEERICVGFLDKMHEHAGRHVKRLGPSVGPIVWKISTLPQVVWDKKYSRQMRFVYQDRYFKGRYSHLNGGRLEIVEVLGKEDGETVAKIDGLDEIGR